MAHGTVFKVGQIARALVVVSIAGLFGAHAQAQIPSSGSVQHMSQSDVRSVSALQAGGDAVSGRALSLNKEGWHTWKVNAVENAPNWCCNSRQGKEVVGAICDLDSRSHGFSHQSKDAIADEMQIYVKITGGQTDSIRTYGANCSVVSQSEIIDHGTVAPTASLDWLAKQTGTDKHIGGDALAAIAVHDSNQAQRLLESAAHANQPLETRKQAIFWMGQVRAQQSVGELTRLMLKDDVEKIREHAVFSVSQSDLQDKLALIDRVARDDGAPEVRGQAWFWLSQTADAQAGQRILAGIEAESNRSVLKQAVFALSQLPDEDAVDALIRVIEQSNYGRELRKQALFWMAQSDSGRAADYLASVLDR